MDQLNLNVLRKRCLVIEDGIYLVLYGMAISPEVDQILVVPNDERRYECYFCERLTQGRLSRIDVETGTVFRVDVVCDKCIVELKVDPTVDLIAVGAARMGADPAERQRRMDERAAWRQKLFDSIVKETRPQLPTVPPAFDSPAAEAEPAPVPESGAPSTRKLLDDIDDLLARVAEDEAQNEAA